MSDACLLSESATRGLVNLLLKRGYFHDAIVPELADKDRKNNDCLQEYAETDVACQLVTAQDGNFMTRDQLQVRLIEEVGAFGGRIALKNAALALAVDSRPIEQVSDRAIAIIRVKDDLIIEQYFDRMAETTNLQLAKQDHVVVSELASTVWDMPIDLTFCALKKRIESGMIGARLVMLLGTNVLVTPVFEQRERNRIRGAFRALTLPTQVSSSHHFHVG